MLQNVHVLVSLSPDWSLNRTFTCMFSLRSLSSCPYRERPLHFSLNVFMQIQCAIHPPSTQFTKLLPFESPLLPSQITQFELSILVLHMAIAALLWSEPRELLYLFYGCHMSDVALSLCRYLTWHFCYFPAAHSAQTFVSLFVSLL